MLNRIFPRFTGTAAGLPPTGAGLVWSRSRHGSVAESVVCLCHVRSRGPHLFARQIFVKFTPSAKAFFWAAAYYPNDDEENPCACDLSDSPLIRSRPASFHLIPFSSRALSSPSAMSKFGAMVMGPAGAGKVS